MKFRPHNVQLARREDAAIQAAATAQFERGSNEWHAECQLLRLQENAELGLMDCYGDYAESLYDFYPGFSWDEAAQLDQIVLVLTDARFPAIAEKLRETCEFDIQAELNAAFTS